MYQLEPILTTNFIVKNHNSAGATAVSDANRALFASEVTLDAAVGSAHAAKDKPYLTLNDKVFAARYAIAAVSPYDVVASLTVEEEPEPEHHHGHHKKEEKSDK